jgi:signal transduction histidine kinase
MIGEFPRALTAASGLTSLVIGFYVFMNGRRRLVNRFFFLMTILLAVWAIAEAMTISVGALSAKIFWTKFQGIGEAPLIPTYLMIALFFPQARSFMKEKRKAMAIISVIYAPFLLGLVLLFTTNFVYSAYRESDNISKIAAVRTPFFWCLEALGFMVILAAIAIFLWQRKQTISPAARKGLLLLALAPVPMLIANIFQNFELNAYVTATQASVFSVTLLAFGVLRYGLFIDLRSMTKRVLIHTSVIIINISLFALICVLYIYALNLGKGPLTFALILLTAIPFMLSYDHEVQWIRRSAVRYLYGREEEENRLLQELSVSIRTVGKLEDLAERVVVKVKESLALTGCALVMKEGDIYRVVGFAFEPDGFGSRFAEVVEKRLAMRKWPGFFSFDDEQGLYSGYWLVGDEIDRGKCRLSHMSDGVFRNYKGGGQVEEHSWRGERQGQAMSVPLQVAGEEVGLLWLISRRDRARFSLEECDFIVALSAQVAVSLKNAQLLQELLDKSNRLRELIQVATTAQEEERIRVSRELHDGLAPYFLDIIYQLDTLEDDIGKESQLNGTMDEVREKARTGLRDLRQVISDLRPSSLDVLGLKKSLGTYLERFGIENNMQVEFKASGDLGKLDPLIEITAFRIAQEALANIGRHAEASHAFLSLACDNGSLEMRIEDDGVGFAEREVRGRVLSGDCLGIKGMTERAELMQADLSINSAPGGGTRLRFSVALTGS